LWFAAVVLITQLVALLFSIASSSLPGCLSALALGFVPSIPQYFDETFILHDALPYLPTTYLYVARAAGWPKYLIDLDVFPVPDASWELGMVVLICCSAALAAATSCLLMAREHAAKRQGRRGTHARI
ncbi:MAG: hypothetical protein SOU51_01595, partial [Collinsella sp.]|nr:hypothetical protein [Collinsella sp.]